MKFLLSAIFWNQSISLLVEKQLFSDAFVDILHIDFYNFPELGLSDNIMVDPEVFLMIFQRYISWFSGHTFNSVCYYKFFWDILCFQINTAINVVARLLICFGDVTCQVFRNVIFPFGKRSTTFKQIKSKKDNMV